MQKTLFLAAFRLKLASPALMLLTALILTHALWGCGAASPDSKATGSLPVEPAADLYNIPQNPFYFARQNGEEAATLPLLSAQQQEETAARAIERFFSPWGLSYASSKLSDAMWGYYALKPERGFMENMRPYSQERWNELASKADVQNYPNRVLPAITVAHSDLRLMPTASPYFFEPSRPGQGYPFDYYQNSSLPLGTPVLITHISTDGAWALIESPSAGGWVDMNRLALVNNEFIIGWKSRPMGTILRENSPLRERRNTNTAANSQPQNNTSGNKLSTRLPLENSLPPVPVFVSIGTVLPLERFPKSSDSLDETTTTLYYPVKGEDGYAKLKKGTLAKEAVAAWPLPLTKENMASLMAQMMSQPYGWGGYGGNRDCSSTLRDLFLAFGAWLPRNSQAQAKLGNGLDLSKMSAQEKEDTVLQQGKAFLSLVGLPGHIMLYIGEYEGRPIVFHNMWGLRTKERGSDIEGRAIVGKAVITTLTPGRERRDISRPNSLLDTVNRLSFPLERK